MLVLVGYWGREGGEVSVEGVTNRVVDMGGGCVSVRGDVMLVMGSLSMRSGGFGRMGDGKLSTRVENPTRWNVKILAMEALEAFIMYAMGALD